MSGLLISVTVLPVGDGACSVVSLSGEADLTTTELRDALAAELMGGPRLVLIDMSGLTFIDSGATQMIIAAHRVARHAGGMLALIRPVGAVDRTLGLMGISRLISVYDSMAEAITALREQL